MRVFELSTRVQSFNRGEGRSATAAAAYRSCSVIACERTGAIHSYTRKRGLEAAEIILPIGAPSWAADRSKLWNAAELRERNGPRGPNASAFKAKAQTAREFMFTFPAELSEEARRSVAREIARHLVERHGVAVDYAIHKPGRTGDDRNFHCHMMATTRRMTAEGLGKKTREWGDLKTGAKLARDLRAFIAGTMNATLKRNGLGDVVHVEHRSFKARGSGQKATRHQGPAKTHAIRKAQQRATAAWAAANRRELTDRHEKDRASLKLRQDFALQGKQAEWSERARLGAAAIRRELAQQRAADIAPTGLRRVFLSVTGRAAREAFNRQARDGARIEAARAKIAGLRAELATERRAYLAAQAKERDVLSARHKTEAAQLRQSLTERQATDRAVEVAGRRAEIGQTHERTRSQEMEGPGLGIR